MNSLSLIEMEQKMCGIVGLFLKDANLQPSLGRLLSDMLVTMTDRGPDSAGIAIYADKHLGRSKFTIQSKNPERDFQDLPNFLSKHLDGISDFRVNDTHAVVTLDQNVENKFSEVLTAFNPEIRIMSHGSSLEIYKEVGLPEQVTQRFHITQMSGRHGIGHTRMATESAVTTLGAHPFNTGVDQCLVHNGSLSNHNSLRRKLKREGILIETENDTEVGAAYLTWKIKNGASLGEALESSLKDLDGFFTFVVGTENGFGVVRDQIACKPAVMAETDQYVAFGSEYKALVDLPKIESAHVWEPEPATVYFWKH